MIVLSVSERIRCKCCHWTGKLRDCLSSDDRSHDSLLEVFCPNCRAVVGNEGMTPAEIKLRLDNAEAVP